jgi:malonyl-CoA/methylmalonyl-CoA synthetase
MKNENLFALFEARAPRNLERTCIETSDGLVYTWRDIWRGSARMAGWLASLALHADADGAPARVLVQVDKSPEAVMLYLAVLRAGLIYVPLNTAYQSAELKHFLADAAPSLVVCTPERVAGLAPLAQAAGCERLATLGSARDGSVIEAATPFADSFRTVRRSRADLAAILYTSGTTGRSKGAMLSHGNLASNALVLDEFWGFAEERDAGDVDVLLHTLPLFHVHGLFVALHAALLAGCPMLFAHRFDAGEIVQLLPRATVFMGVPTYYTRLLDERGFDRHACRNMRLFISGSAPLLAETFESFAARCGHTIVERYGMSETVMLTSNPYFGSPRDRRAGTVGRALPGVAVRVMNEDGTPCRVGEIGAVQVRGPNVFSGYWHLPEKNASEFTTDGWFITGDLGQLGGTGLPDDVLTLVGRSKDLIISGGYNVYPKEIEGYLDALAGVAESAVIGVPHRDFGEAVCAVVVAAPGEPPDPAALIAHLRAQIASFKVPKRIWLETALPRNAMGKVQKNLLRSRYASAFADPPASSTTSSGPASAS